jgi:hypothetical protein
VSARQGAGAMAMGRPRVAVRHAGQKKAARAAPRGNRESLEHTGPRALAAWRASRAFSNPGRQDGQHREGDPFSLAGAKASYGVVVGRQLLLTATPSRISESTLS